MAGSGSDNVARTVWHAGELVEGSDTVAAEVAVALVYNGISHVVMMATPADLEDFALGFSLSEGILASPKQLLDYEEISTDKGIELALTIAAEPFAALKQRRRNLVGRTGCGLCGAESLEQAITIPNRISAELSISHVALQRAIAGIGDGHYYNSRPVPCMAQLGVIPRARYYCCEKMLAATMRWINYWAL